jgi:hypothetical protein
MVLTSRIKGGKMLAREAILRYKEVLELRKVMLLAAMLAMVMAAAAPALAQPTATATTETGDATVTQYAAVCQNVFDEINAVGVQYAGSFNEVDAEDDAQLSQDIAAELGVSVEVVNQCLNFFGATATPTATVVAKKAPKAAHAKKWGYTASATPTASGGSGGSYGSGGSSGGSGGSGGSSGGSSGSYSGGSLPATGGPVVPSALALGAGVLLVAGGLLARRLVR